MDFGMIFMYSVFAVLQIYILMTVGVVSFYKKIYNGKSITAISEILMKFFLPVLGMIEIGKMTNLVNIDVAWLLVVNMFICFIIGFCLSRLIHHLFSLDERISYGFSLSCSVPSLGTFPLVMGKAFCYPGGPLEGDSLCDGIQGLMMINYLIFSFIVFIFGFILIMKDKNFNSEITKKMEYLWHILINKKVFDYDYTVKYFMFKYLDYPSKVLEEKFVNFSSSYQLQYDEDKVDYVLKRKANYKLRETQKKEENSPKAIKSLDGIIRDRIRYSLNYKKRSSHANFPQDETSRSKSLDVLVFYKATEDIIPEVVESDFTPDEEIQPKEQFEEIEAPIENDITVDDQITVIDLV